MKKIMFLLFIVLNIVMKFSNADSLTFLVLWGVVLTGIYQKIFKIGRSHNKSDREYVCPQCGRVTNKMGYCGSNCATYANGGF